MWDPFILGGLFAANTAVAAVSLIAAGRARRNARKAAFYAANARVDREFARVSQTDALVAVGNARAAASSARQAAAEAIQATQEPDVIPFPGLYVEPPTTLTIAPDVIPFPGQPLSAGDVVPLLEEEFGDPVA